jgi:hypothetical protein
MSLPFEAPQRSNSFPTKLRAPQERHAELSNNNINTKKSVDDTLPRRAQTWLWDGTSDSTESPASMSPSFSHQSSPAASQILNQTQAQQPFVPSQQVCANQALPDLMPLMFPSGDQLAYPAQPMSTLEDGHFKEDMTNSPMQYTPESFAQGNTSVLNGGFAQNTVANNFDGFSGIQGLSGTLPTRNATALAPHLQRLGLDTQLYSPATQSSSTPETMQSPDLVTLPHNYVWQNFGPSNQNNSREQLMKKEQIIGDNNLAVDDGGMASMGMNFDMDVNFGELLGANTSNASAMNDDWSQWMNNGV